MVVIDSKLCSPPCLGLTHGKNQQGRCQQWNKS